MNAKLVVTPLFCAIAGSASASSMPEAWQAYAASKVAPQFSWTHAPQSAAPSALSTHYSARAADSSKPQAVWSWVADAQRTLVPWQGLAVQSEGLLRGDLLRGELNATGIASQVRGTRLAFQAGADREFGITAVVARQHFATQGFGYGDWDGTSGQRYLGVGTNVYESSSGSGVRLDWAAPLDPAGDMRWNLAVQSRVEMDPFNAYRGVYAEPGDFDIPGSASLSFDRALGDAVGVRVEVQRVFYSDVDTFTSASLPTRFLSLLGDGGSPAFAWKDLTVYALETSVADGFGGSWNLRFTTQQQPRPTSRVLDNALSELYSDTNAALAYEFGGGNFGDFRIAASYSPVSYFLGTSPYIDRDFEPGSQVEFEAQWTLHF